MSRLMKTIIFLIILFIVQIGITSATSEYAAEEQQMLDLINGERAIYGLEPLRFNAVLNDVASEHSKEMIELDYFSHDSYDGTSFSERLANAGYDMVYVGENIALRYPPDLVAAHEGLMASPGHRANILSPNYNEIGIGIWVGEYSGYDNAAMYTQNFGWGDSTTTALQVMRLSPTDSIIESDKSARTFSIGTNVECDIIWSLKGETIKVDSDVLSSYCELVPPAGGTYQVKATASGSAQNVVTEWTWLVVEETVMLKGDANNDGLINILDFSAFAKVYNSTTTGTSKWADFNDDGMINILDFSAFAKVYNK
ncbi:CAP domain-containing protein [Methanolobus mangrovi]|uniref:CAP domain-containing protein n=1 Tax=Methanolobus mangrovi TaxID=3072977 RepID=A0AA51UEV2_9EURY|nr:CAP domain-containing protein [Methanolobus mangrovi]WMW21850.1 CAP domain-containing protein [Methanolobus mangrovi]